MTKEIQLRLALSTLLGYIDSSSVISEERIKSGGVICDKWFEDLRNKAAAVDKLLSEVSSLKQVSKELAEVEINRASGEAICEVCGKKYYDHPPDLRFWEEVAYGNGKHYWVTLLCDGSTVKL